MKPKRNEIRVMKKYQNRRLYDTATSTYVILQDIKQMLVDGELISVIDTKTEVDVTRSVLLQIILDEEAKDGYVFSDRFLVQLIKLYGKSFHASLIPFLEQVLDLFRNLQKSFYEQVRQVYGKDKLSLGVVLWKDFMKQNGSYLESLIKEQLQHNTSKFLRIHEANNSSASNHSDDYGSVFCNEFANMHLDFYNQNKKDDSAI